MNGRTDSQRRRSAAGLRGGLLAGLVAFAVTACTPLYRNHGYIPSDEDLSGVIVGIDTRDTVADVIGPPTANGVLNDGGFYYVQSRFRTVGPFRPDEIDRQVVAISFDAEGIVANIERFGLEAGRVVVLNRRVTEDNVRNTSFIRQLLGSVGNVSAEDLLGEP